MKDPVFIQCVFMSYKMPTICVQCDARRKVAILKNIIYICRKYFWSIPITTSFATKQEKTMWKETITIHFKKNERKFNKKVKWRRQKLWGV